MKTTKFTISYFLNKLFEFQIIEITDDYFSFYLLDLNMAISLLFMIIIMVVDICSIYFNCHYLMNLSAFLIYTIISAIFVIDSIKLRKEIAEMTKTEPN